MDKEQVKPKSDAGKRKNFVDFPGDIDLQLCDNGHKLYMTERKSELEDYCYHCESEIKFGANCITCTGKCPVTYCFQCSGCPN